MTSIWWCHVKIIRIFLRSYDIWYLIFDILLRYIWGVIIYIRNCVRREDRRTVDRIPVRSSNAERGITAKLCRTRQKIRPNFRSHRNNRPPLNSHHRLVCRYHMMVPICLHISSLWIPLTSYNGRPHRLLTNCIVRRRQLSIQYNIWYSYPLMRSFAFKSNKPGQQYN